MFLYLIQDQIWKFKHFGGKKKFQPKKSLSIVLHQALQLLKIRLEMSLLLHALRAVYFKG